LFSWDVPYWTAIHQKPTGRSVCFKIVTSPFPTVKGNQEGRSSQQVANWVTAILLHIDLLLTLSHPKVVHVPVSPTLAAKHKTHRHLSGGGFGKLKI
jgi:hypothetical protein